MKGGGEAERMEGGQTWALRASAMCMLLCLQMKAEWSMGPCALSIRVAPLTQCLGSRMRTGKGIGRGIGIGRGREIGMAIAIEMQYNSMFVIWRVEIPDLRSAESEVTKGGITPPYHRLPAVAFLRRHCPLQLLALPEGWESGLSKISG